MPVTTAYYNATSGNDGNSGSNTTVVSGTSGDATAAGHTLTLNGTFDFLDVLDDGSDLVWVDASAGDRHLFTVSSFNPSVSAATTLGVDQEFTSTLVSSNWSVGGKRQSLVFDSSNVDTLDMQSGWRYEIEDGTYTISTQLDLPAEGSVELGAIEIVAASGASPVFSWTADQSCFVSTGTCRFKLKGITLTNTTSTWIGSRGIYSNTGSPIWIIENCNIDVAGEALSLANASAYILNCDLTSSQNRVLFLNSRSLTIIKNCYIHDGAGIGIDDGGNSSFAPTFITGNRITNNTGIGISSRISGSAKLIEISNNIIHGNSAGIVLAYAADALLEVSINNNIISNNSGYGMSSDTTNVPEESVVLIKNNAFYLNSSGNTNNLILASDAGNINLSGDPYTNAALDIYTLNSTVGGGADCRNAGLGYSG